MPSPDRRTRIETTLTQAFTPLSLEVIDESHQHAGHAGARPEGETHYRVRMVTPAFAGLSRVEMHRRVNASLLPEFDRGLHALALELKGG
jgi:BolA family transcriptional regulator, general stress-responsive regulator